jgi:hypothetical protein
MVARWLPVDWDAAISLSGRVDVREAGTVSMFVEDARTGRRFPLKVQTGEAAASVADLRSMVDDLEHVVHLCDLRDTMEHQLARQACWESAVITYGRCFTSGKSHGGKRRGRSQVARDLVEELPELLAAVHRDVLEERDKHVAHRVNDAEVVKIATMLNESGAPVGMTVLKARRQGPPDSTGLRSLAAYVRDHLAVRLQEEWQALSSGLLGQDAAGDG